MDNKDKDNKSPIKNNEIFTKEELEFNLEMVEHMIADKTIFEGLKAKKYEYVQKLYNAELLKMQSSKDGNHKINEIVNKFTSETIIDSSSSSSSSSSTSNNLSTTSTNMEEINKFFSDDQTIDTYISLMLGGIGLGFNNVKDIKNFLTYFVENNELALVEKKTINKIIESLNNNKAPDIKLIMKLQLLSTTYDNYLKCITDTVDFLFELRSSFASDKSKSNEYASQEDIQFLEKLKTNLSELNDLLGRNF